MRGHLGQLIATLHRRSFRRLHLSGGSSHALYLTETVYSVLSVHMCCLLKLNGNLDDVALDLFESVDMFQEGSRRDPSSPLPSTSSLASEGAERLLATLFHRAAESLSESYLHLPPDVIVSYASSFPLVSPELQQEGRRVAVALLQRTKCSSDVEVRQICRCLHRLGCLEEASALELSRGSWWLHRGLPSKAMEFYVRAGEIAAARRAALLEHALCKCIAAVLKHSLFAGLSRELAGPVLAAAAQAGWQWETSSERADESLLPEALLEARKLLDAFSGEEKAGNWLERYVLVLTSVANATENIASYRRSSVAICEMLVPEDGAPVR